MSSIVYIPKEEIIRLHDDLILASGGIQGLLNEGNLEYIVASAPHVSEPTLPNVAGYILGRIAKGHPFNDGNKRTAYFASRFFLMRNGADFNGLDFDQATSEVESIAQQASMDSACDLARIMTREHLVANGLIIPDYNTFRRIVIKSIGVAKRLADR